MIKLEYNFTFLNEYINAERSNRYKGAKIKRDTTLALHYMLLNEKKIKTPCRLNFHWIIPNKRRDLDNIGFAKKFILDAMVKAKIIPNDNLTHVIELRDTFELGNKVGVIIEVVE